MHGAKPKAKGRAAPGARLVLDGRVVRRAARHAGGALRRLEVGRCRRDWFEVSRKAPWGGRACSAQRCTFGQLYVVGGVAAKCTMLQDTWRSPDGVEWECMTQGVRVPWCGARRTASWSRTTPCSYWAAMMPMARYDVWRSFDGKHWRHVCDAPWPARCMAAAVAHEKDIFSWAAGR